MHRENEWIVTPLLRTDCPKLSIFFSLSCNLADCSLPPVDVAKWINHIAHVFQAIYAGAFFLTFQHTELHIWPKQCTFLLRKHVSSSEIATQLNLDFYSHINIDQRTKTEAHNKPLPEAQTCCVRVTHKNKPNCFSHIKQTCLSFHLP